MKAFSFCFGLSAALLAIGSASCSKSDSGSGTGTLTQAYPADLAVTSPFASSSPAGGDKRLDLFALEADPGAPEVRPFTEKRDAIEAKLTATEAGACGFNLNLFRTGRHVECYGPTLNYTNHPDASGGEPRDGQLPSGDVGIWSETEQTTGEACIAAKVNSLVGEIEGQVDTATDLLTAMFCIANVEGKGGLPAVGEEKDFTAEVAGLNLPFAVDRATVGRQPDTADGHPVYVSEISGAASVNDREISTSVHLKHIPTASDNSAYRGRLWYTISGDVGSPGGNCGPAGSRLFALAVLYSKSAEGELRYRMQRAEYCDENALPFDSKNALDASNKAGRHPEPPGAGWAGNFRDATVELDVADGSGAFSFAWQAGPHDGNTRTFLAELNREETGGLSGCGYFGYGPDVADERVGEIDGLICSWAGPGNIHDPMTPKVQRQCVSLDTASGKFVSDSATLAITYAPTNSCDSPGGDFTYGNVTGPVPNNLIDISLMREDVAVPERPEEL